MIHNSLFIILLCLLLFLPLATEGAILYLEPAVGQYHQNDIFLVEIRLDTQGEVINTMNVDLSFSPEILEVKDFSKGNSVLTLWVEEPAFSEGVISFAGGIPGGYQGVDGLLAKIVFRANNQGQGRVSFEDSKALLNDGKGTEAKLTTMGAVFEIAGVGPLQDEWREEIKQDKILPEPFKVEISQDPAVFEGKYFITFLTTDKQTGINHYEVKEGRRDWKIATSPYVLENQKLTSDIRVKAIDKAGNYWMEILKAPNQQQTKRGIYIALVLILIIGILIWRILRRRTKYEKVNDS